MADKCVSGKKMFISLTIAEDALIELWSKNEYRQGEGPVAAYCCEDCGQYHLTSKGPMNERLAEALAGDELRIRREANKWIDKLK